MELKIHEKHIDAVVAELETDPENGITQSEADARLIRYGTNELEKPPRISLLMLLVIQLNTVIMYLMMGAVFASAAIRATGPDGGNPLNYIDAIAIFIIVMINATIAAVTENNANDALEALSSLQSPITTVIRGGEEVQAGGSLTTSPRTTVELFLLLILRASV